MTNKRKRIEYALDHLPRGSSVEDVRAWLAEQGQDVPTRSYASSVVNGWRAANGVADTNGKTVLTPQLAAALR